MKSAFRGLCLGFNQFESYDKKIVDKADHLKVARKREKVEDAGVPIFPSRAYHHFIYIHIYFIYLYIYLKFIYICYIRICMYNITICIHISNYILYM